VADPGGTGARGLIGGLLERERRFLARIEGVLRFDRAMYREIENDPHAIPQAIAVVVVTAALAALGQGSLVSIFVGLGGVIVLWMAATGLIWAVGQVSVGTSFDFSKLLRCSGFAYAWFALLLFADLPVVGPIFAGAAVVLSLASLVLATREVLETDTLRATAICGVALGIPLLVLLWVAA
jgi:hypothetical protein